MAPVPDGTLRLTIELVPKRCWYSNMRQVLTREEWDELRRRVYAEYQQRCGICSAWRGPGSWLHCHERWSYDDRAHVQRLEGFMALCEWCHLVKHIGLFPLLTREERVRFEQVVQHFLRVNGCDHATFDQHYRAAFRLWGERNRHVWRTDFGDYASLIPSPIPMARSASP